MKKPVIILLCMAMMLSTVCLAADSSKDTAAQPVKPKSNYVTHAPIHITTNADFATQAANEGWPGDGTQNNPYVIENYDINGTGYSYCIWIEATTCYFIINNTCLHDTNGGTGIRFDGKNGYISNNSIYNNVIGIYLYCSRFDIINNNTLLWNSDAGISLHGYDGGPYCNNITIQNNIAQFNGYGIYMYNTGDSLIINNSLSFNDYGIRDQSAFTGFPAWREPPPIGNNYTNNIISNNMLFGLSLHIIFNGKSENGYSPPTGVYSIAYSNCFINNTVQAEENGGWRRPNAWNYSYPIGGNYWSNYTGVDLMSGPLQDQPGPDGIGDTPYIINAIGQDYYPLMAPVGGTQYNISLQQGWNLISVPLIQANESLKKGLTSIPNKWNVIQTYNSTNTYWKSNSTFKPDSLNDLKAIDNKIGIWIHITEPNVTLTVYGYIPTSTAIPLRAGWNLVGYPTLNTTTTVANALWGTGADRVEVCDQTDPYRTKEVGPTYVMKPGEGYWVHVPTDIIWIVDW